MAKWTCKALFATLACLSFTQYTSAAVPKRPLRPRQTTTGIGAGFSLQLSPDLTTCPTNTKSCAAAGSGCCPSTLNCPSASNNPQTVCCDPAAGVADCSGDVRGRPAACADSAWSLFTGKDGASLCCEVGYAGLIDNGKNNPGTCVASASISAIVAATPTMSVAPQISAGAGPPAAPQISAGAGPPASSKQVFFHYMIADLTPEHIKQDIEGAMKVGADAFAVNIANVVDAWALRAVDNLFTISATAGFKLFFSFDMVGFKTADQFVPFLAGVLDNPKYKDVYYLRNGKPLVSTFNGAGPTFTMSEADVNTGWQVHLKDAMAKRNPPHLISFMPAFSDASEVQAKDIFTAFPSADGAMNWFSWPSTPEPVNTIGDSWYQNSAKNHTPAREFIMGMTTIQYKHMDANQNYYLPGMDNFNVRMGQVLKMQPDMLELQTWNDVGEGHNMGYIWPEAITTATAIQAYSADHSAFLEVLGGFITAYKTGARTVDQIFPSAGNVQGVFYYHKLMTTATCAKDALGKPRGMDLVKDFVTAVILVAKGQTGLSAVMSYGGKATTPTKLVPGFNNITISDLTPGSDVSVTVSDATGKVVSGTGPAPATTSTLCNYNLNVVALK